MSSEPGARVVHVTAFVCVGLLTLPVLCVRCLCSTPDCRRLLTPATHSTSHMMGVKTPASAGSASAMAGGSSLDLDQACINSGEMNLTGY